VPAALLMSSRASRSGEGGEPASDAPAANQSPSTKHASAGKSGSPSSAKKSDPTDSPRASTANPRDRAAAAAEREEPGASAGLPVRVARALAAKKIVVVFFYQRRGADDAATAKAVKALNGRAARTRVFSAPIKDVERYRRVVQGLGVSQAPAVVIVDRRGKARLVEGYVDSESLLQQVRDAR